MKISNPRLIRHGGFVGGAIIESGDGDLIIPGLVQQVIELGDPISRVFGSAQALPLNPGLQTEQSFFKSAFINVVGAGAGSTATVALIAKGVWHFQVSATHGFFGTNNAAVRSDVLFQDGDGNQVELAAFPNVIGRDSVTMDFVVSIERAGTAIPSGFFIQSAATIAADGLWINTFIYGKRIA